MKVILNYKVDFAEINLSSIPRIGESVFYDNEEYVIYDVEWCLDGIPHVNLMLNKA